MRGAPKSLTETNTAFRIHRKRTDICSGRLAQLSLDRPLQCSVVLAPAYRSLLDKCPQLASRNRCGFGGVSALPQVSFQVSFIVDEIAVLAAENAALHNR